MDPERFVFLDETATTTDMGRRYGRSPLGERLMAAVPQGHWKTTTFVAGLRQSGIVAPLVLDGPMTGAAFCAYVEQFLRARSPAPGGMALSGREAAVRRRSLQDLVATLGELRAAGVDLFLHQQAIDTTTPQRPRHVPDAGRRRRVRAGDDRRAGQGGPGAGQGGGETARAAPGAGRRGGHQAGRGGGPQHP
jgi:hypothetical protein